MQRTLDRRIEFDEASRDWDIRDLIEPDTEIYSRSWWVSKTLDQGWEGACVGFAWAHELLARPYEMRRISDIDARNIYHRARELDEWEGEDYEGTSVLGGIKAVQSLHPGLIKEYRWAFDLNDVLRSLSRVGPVVLGVNWYEGMDSPDSRGWIHVDGDVVGGHAILARAVSTHNKSVRLHNSWSSAWGRRGDCFLSWDDLERLLGEFGEACIPISRAYK